MFKNDNDMNNKVNDFEFTSPTTNEPETIIGPSVRVEGNFRGDGNVIIDGEVKGTIKTKRDVKIGEKAKVNANVECINAYISGEIQGNIKIKEKLELTATARVTGDIVTKSIQINNGAVVNGTIKMGEDILHESEKPTKEPIPKTEELIKTTYKTKKK